MPGPSEEVKIVGSPLLTYFIAFLMLMFALCSYPMMYKGYDVWSMMEIIGNPKLHSNNLWHISWKNIFEVIGFSSEESFRALFIHRIQTAVALALIACSAYLFFETAFKKIDLHLKIQLAFVSVACWLLINGTYSSPLGEPHYSARHVFSWLQWYSVNYQITLPMFFFCSASLLKAVTSIKFRTATAWYAITLVAAIFIGMIHAAEIVYLLFLVGGIFLIYVLPRGDWRVAALVALVLFASLFFGLQFSHKQPYILKLIFLGRWSDLSTTMHEFGYLLVDLNLNRSETSWHSMHTLSLICVVVALGIGRAKELHQLLWLVAFSTILAISIHTRIGAGILAMIIGEFITWRFGFSTLLYLGIPLLIGAWLEGSRKIASPFNSSAIVMSISAMLIASVLIYSRFFEPLQPAYNFAKSLAFSLNPRLGHFPM